MRLVASFAGLLCVLLASSPAKTQETDQPIVEPSPEMDIQHRVEEVGSAGSMNRQCIELFRTTLRGRRIEFPRAGADLSTSAFPLLDELIQIAVDCPAASIDVTGHTDSVGEESVNQPLSRARAEAVAAYLEAGGIAKKRISAQGVGSSKPLVSEDNAQARQLNRRIDIEISFP